jgi:8-amino-7-oxononanoate synthase
MFRERLDQLAARSLTRRLQALSSATGPTVQFSGRQVILLSSNDYLGLATHPEVVQAAVEATQRYGAGAGASRLISGTLPPHERLESALAAFKQTEAALVFSSGYLANLGAISCLIGRGGLILADRLCHASLIDACRLSGADFRVYRHADCAHVETLLKRRQRGRPTLIATDGLFSMDGDLAPLPDLVTLARRYDATLYVDDAHGTGVMGMRGRGTVEHFAVESEIPFHMGTLGKALGSSGAYVAGPRDLIDYLINTSRPFLFTTASPPWRPPRRRSPWCSASRSGEPDCGPINSGSRKACVGWAFASLPRSARFSPSSSEQRPRQSPLPNSCWSTAY